MSRHLSTGIAHRDSFRRIARVVKGRWLESALSRVSHEQEREKDYRRTDPQYINTTNIKSPPYLKYPYQYQVLRRKHGNLLTELERDVRWRTASPVSVNHDDFGDEVSKWLRHNYDLPHHDLRRSNPVVLSRGLKMGLKYGVNWWTARFQSDEDFWGVAIENVAWEDVFPDWKEARWNLVRTYQPVHKVVEMMASSVELPVVDPDTGEEIPNYADEIVRNAKWLIEEVKRGTVSTSRYNFWYAQDRNRHQQDTGKVDDSDEYGDSYWVAAADDPLQQRIPVLEYHERRPGGLVIKMVPAYGEFGDDLLFASNFSPYRYSQLVPFIPFEVDEEEWGNSLSYVTGQLDEVASWSLRATLRYLARTADPAILYRANVKMPKHNKEILSNRVLEVESPDDVKFMDPPNNHGLHQLAFGITKQAMMEGQAESEQRMGQTGKGTATGQQIAHANAGVDDGLIALCAKQSLSHLSRLKLEILRVHLTRERAFRMRGLEGGSTIFKLRPEYMDATYAIEIHGPLVTPDPSLQATGISNMWQKYGPAILDGTKCALREATLLGIPGVEELLANRDGPEPQDPSDEHMALLDGQVVRVSPRENMQQHLQEHVMFQQQLGRSLPPDHPAHRNLQDHVMVTQQMFLMQQQQMAGKPPAPALGGGGGGGPGATQPGQPGGNGNIRSPGEGEQRLRQTRSEGGDPGSNPAIPALAPGRQAAVR